MDRWHIELRKGHSKDGQSRPVICNEQGERIAVVSLRGEPGGDPERAAINAALLASVPELNDKLLELEEQRDALLAACEALCNAIEQVGDADRQEAWGWGEDDEEERTWRYYVPKCELIAYDAAQAAIAKAKQDD